MKAQDRINPQLDLDFDPLPVEKTLGVWWCVERDASLFRIREPGDANTKSEMLRHLAAIYDPLGLLALVVITAKVMLQKTW